MRFPRPHGARFATAVKAGIFIATLTVTTLLPMFSNPQTTRADASCSPNGAFLSGTDPSWLNGSAVNVCNNGGVSTDDYGPSCFTKTGGPGGSGCPSGTIYAGEEWQCVELVNRLYLAKGWISGTWSGNGNTLINSLPASLTDQINGHISYVNTGDVITLDDGGYGHAAIVNTIGSNSSLNIVNQNTTQSNLYSSATLSNGTSLSAGNAFYNSSWFGYTVQAIVHHPAGGGTTGSPALSDVDGNRAADLFAMTATPTGSAGFELLSTWQGFQSPQQWWDGTGLPWSAVTPLVGDVDGDGKADLIYITNNAPNGIQVWVAQNRTDGTAGFTTPQLWSNLPSLAYSNIKASLGDADGNGCQDVVLTNNEATGFKAYALLSTCSATRGFLAPQMWFDGSGYSWSGITPMVGDVDGGKTADYIFVTNEGANGIKAFVAASDGTKFAYTTPQPWSTQPGLMYNGLKMTLGDADGNAGVDLILTTQQANGFNVLVQESTWQSFLAPQMWFDGTGYSWTGVTPFTGDTDGDKHADYQFMTDEGANGIKVFDAHSNGDTNGHIGFSFTTPQPWATVPGWAYSGVAAYLK